jgi:hypothetical protein
MIKEHSEDPGVPLVFRHPASSPARCRYTRRDDPITTSHAGGIRAESAKTRVEQNAVAVRPPRSPFRVGTWPVCREVRIPYRPSRPGAVRESVSRALDGCTQPARVLGGGHRVPPLGAATGGNGLNQACPRHQPEPVTLQGWLLTGGLLLRVQPGELQKARNAAFVFPRARPGPEVAEPDDARRSRGRSARPRTQEP